MKHNYLSRAMFKGAHSLHPLTSETLSPESLINYLKTSKVYKDNGYSRILEETKVTSDKYTKQLRDHLSIGEFCHKLRHEIEETIIEGCAPMDYIEDMMFCISLLKTRDNSLAYAENLAVHFASLIKAYSDND